MRECGQLNICMKWGFCWISTLVPLWQKWLARPRENASKDISRFWSCLCTEMGSEWQSEIAAATENSCPHVKHNIDFFLNQWLFPFRLSCRFLRLSLCWGVSLSEWSRLWPHHGTVLLQDRLYRTQLWAQWVCLVVLTCRRVAHSRVKVQHVLNPCSCVQSVPQGHLATAASSCVSVWTMPPVTTWPEPATAASALKASVVTRVRTNGSVKRKDGTWSDLFFWFL